MATPADVLDAAIVPESWRTNLNLPSWELDYSIGHFGMPSQWKGASWCVLKAIDSNGDEWALRIPHIRSAASSPRLERLERLQKILDKIKPYWFPPFVVHRDAIEIKGELCPIVVMPFLKDVPLTKFIEKEINSGSGKSLAALAEKLPDLSRRMIAEGFDHGDVSPGNLLVTKSGDLRLIDPDMLLHIDCAVAKSFELGHPSCNHPMRIQSDVGPGLHVFPLHLLELSLLAISSNTDLVDEKPDPEALLFSESDLRNHRKSKTFGKVRKSLLNGGKKLYDAIVASLDCNSLMEATKVLHPSIERVSKPRVIFSIQDINELKMPHSPIQQVPVANGKKRRRMLAPSLSEDLKRRVLGE